MERRLGFVGIVVDDKNVASESINRTLSQHADLIAARLGIPNVQGDACVITLVVRATSDEVGRLTGKLGMLDGVQVKSALAKTVSGASLPESQSKEGRR